MEQLAAHARSLEAHGDLQEAREKWLACLPLLPAQSMQAQWIHKHVAELGASPSPQSTPASRSTPEWAKKLGPVGPILLALWKFKFLFSFLTFLGVYWQLWGAAFGIGFAILILVHEMGHFIDIKRRGLPADMPMFLPGLGAYVKWNALGVSLEARAAVSLAGPFAGALGAGVCYLLWHQTGYGLWAALARTSAWLNVMNLIPLWIFDGSSATNALSKLERAVVVLVSAALCYPRREWIFGVVAAGMAVRLFTRDAPEDHSNTTAAYFVAVLTGLALVLWLVPGQGNGLH